MKEFAIYTALRLLLFLATWGVITGLSVLIFDHQALGATFLIALVISGIGSYFLLREQREAFAQRVEARAQLMSERIGRTERAEADDESTDADEADRPEGSAE